MLFVLERCLPLRASDVAFGSDVHCVSDVSPCGEVGKHHITLRRRSNTSLWRSHNITAACRNITLYKRSELCYYRVKYALVCTRNSFLKEPPKDDFEEYARKVIVRAYFIILNEIDGLDGTNERLLKYYTDNQICQSK